MLKQQSGSAIVVVLIMLVTVTILATISLRGTMSEQQVTRSLQFHTNSFAAGNSEIESWFTDIRDTRTRSDDLFAAMQEFETDASGQPSLDADGNLITTPIDVAPLFTAADQVSVSSTIQYTASAPASVSITLSGDSSAGRYRFYPFEVVSRGAQATSSSTQAMGVTLRASTGR